MALTYSEISSITEKYFVPKLVDNIFASNEAFMRAKKKWYEKGSGERVVQPVAYATTSAAGRFYGADSLDNTANDQISGLEFLWKQYYASIQITRLDELKNSGKEQVINFVKGKVQLAEKSLASLIGTDIFADGTTANSIVGLKAVTDTTSTYGGVSKTAYSWLQGKVDSTTTALSYIAIRKLLGRATIDADSPTVGFCLQSTYDDLVGLFQPQQRFTDSKTADAGFSNIMFEGRPIIVDSHVSSGYMHFVNENYMNILHLEDFRFDPFIKPTNQAVSVAHIFWTAAMTCSNPRMQAMFTALA